MRQYTYHAVINNIKIESCNIEVLVQDINSTIGFPIVSRDSLYNYFNRPQRMKSKLKAYEFLTLSRNLASKIVGQ